MLPWLPPPRQGVQAAKGLLRPWQRRVATCHDMESTLQPPSTCPTAVHQTRMGPCGVSRRSLVELFNVTSSVGVCQRWMSAWACRLTLLTMLLLPTAQYSPKPDPLVLELCMGKGPPAWVDSMLEELATLLVLIVGAPMTGCPMLRRSLKKLKHRLRRRGGTLSKAGPGQGGQVRA